MINAKQKQHSSGEHQALMMINAKMGGHRCCTKQKVKRGLWSPEEDEKLVTYITNHGLGSWSSVPKFAGKYCFNSLSLSLSLSLSHTHV